MPKRHYSKTIPARIEKLLTDEDTHNDSWVMRFLPSIQDYYKRKGNITDNQYVQLVKLEEKYSPDNKAKIKEQEVAKQRELAEKRAKWEKYYLEEVKEDAIVVARYYKGIYEAGERPYFENVWTAVLNDEIPAENNCIRMMTNDYAQKVLNEWKKEPKYPVKTLVQPRKQVKESVNHPLYGVDYAFVMKIDPEVPSAVNGGKKYIVLPKGDFKKVIVQEREIKEYKGKA